MNTSVIFSVILVLCQFALAKKSVPNILKMVSKNSNCEAAGLQCKDCETIQFCSKKMESLFVINCSDQNSDTPYCDSETHTCTNKMPASCNQGDASYICPGVGYYPDPLDCQKYVYCDEDKVAHRFECSSDQNYDQSVQSCRTEAICTTYDSVNGLCKGKLNTFVSYAPSKNLYVFCTYGMAPVLFQCPHKGDIFNEDDQSCVFECTQNGFYPYAKDETKYYACTKIGNTFIKSLLHCYPGTRFIEFGDGQGICTTKLVTTTTTTEVSTTTEVTTSAVPEQVTEEVIATGNTNANTEEDCNTTPLVDNTADTEETVDERSVDESNNKIDEENLIITTTEEGIIEIIDSSFENEEPNEEDTAEIDSTNDESPNNDGNNSLEVTLEEQIIEIIDEIIKSEQGLLEETNKSTGNEESLVDELQINDVVNIENLQEDSREETETDKNMNDNEIHEQVEQEIENKVTTEMENLEENNEEDNQVVELPNESEEEIETQKPEEQQIENKVEVESENRGQNNEDDTQLIEAQDENEENNKSAEPEEQTTEENNELPKDNETEIETTNENGTEEQGKQNSDDEIHNQNQGNESQLVKEQNNEETNKILEDIHETEEDEHNNNI